TGLTMSLLLQPEQPVPIGDEVLDDNILYWNIKKMGIVENAKNTKVVKGFPWKLEPLKYFDHQGEEWVSFSLINSKSEDSMFWLCDTYILLTIKHSTDATKNIYS
ncbi:hypothetical protein PFISCL1PPCAC_28296, partial [Pristionchus fissidentatus]